MNVDDPGTGQEPVADDERLTCGRGVADLLDQVAEGRAGILDAHQERCPHCRAALVEYERLWAPVLEMAAERPAAPVSVLDRALRSLRRTLEHPDYGVLASADGLTLVSARVVVVAAREAAEQVTGVRVALSRSRRDQADDGGPVDGGPDTDGPDDGEPDAGATGAAKVEAGVAGRTAALEITLAADYGSDLVELGDRVRTAVTEQVRALTGLEPDHVLVVVDDVLT